MNDPDTAWKKAAKELLGDHAEAALCAMLKDKDTWSAGFKMVRAILVRSREIEAAQAQEK
jgi:hypothetical protein